MPTYEIRIRHGRPSQVVQADEMHCEGRSIVFRTVQLVILTPCWIIRWRFAASEIADPDTWTGHVDPVTNSSVKPDQGLAHESVTWCTPWSGRRTRGTRACRQALCWKKSR